ncbi:T9SS type A sorting domain-containing protein [bacterium AH-315-J21]|nr:T9SS type A sorting domain-containing protein [bacterium AH-315-J21]
MKYFKTPFRFNIYGISTLVAALVIYLATTAFYKESVSTKIEIEDKATNNAESTSTIFATSPQLRFIENQGQAGPNAKYHVQGAGHTVLFHSNKITLRRDVSPTLGNEIVLRFDGANESPKVDGVEKLAGVAHFYKGQSPDQWHTNVPTYKSVMYTELYPGIDMAYIGASGDIESEFYLAPGVDYHQIHLNYQGVQSRTIRNDGALVLKTELGELIEKAPFAYQDINGSRVEVEAEYKILADASIGFELSSYDSEFPLVIDPQLTFITVVPGFNSEFANAVVKDASGNIIGAGGGNRFFPANDVIDASNHVGGLGNDGLLIKTDSVGNVIYSALFGGRRPDYFTDMVTDASGFLYLTGFTSSKDFPVLNPAQDSSGGQDDAFLVILDSTGVLMYGTYLGGSSGEFGNGIAIDSSGNIYIGGTTESSDYPTLNAFQSTLLGSFTTDVFLAKYNPLGELVYSTFLGGSDKDRLSGLEVTSDGQLTITGGTVSEDFPLMNPYQDTLGGVKSSTGDIFISRLNAAGDALIYSTYFGGIEQEWSHDLALGPDGSAYICGGAVSPNFPIVNAMPSTPEADSVDGILICFDNSGQPTYSVRTNIPGYDIFVAVAVDASSNVFAAGDWLDSIRFYQKTIDRELEISIQFAATGHSMSSIFLQNNSLAFATTFRDPALGLATLDDQGSASANSSFSSFGVGNLAQAVKNAVWAIGFENSALNLDYDFGDGILKLGVNPSGKVTVNDKDTEIPAGEVKEVNVNSIDVDNFIDLSNISPNEFPSIISTDVNTGEGRDMVWASLSPNVKNLIRVGAGGDIIYATLWVEFLGSLLNGGSGSDLYQFLSGSNGQESSSESLGPKTSRSAALPITIVDSSGIDTLSFAGYSEAITLDLEIQNTPQTIDANGVQIILDGIFEVVNASAFDDEITVAPLLSTPRHIDGAAGSDILNIAPVGVQSADDGSTITTPGYADISYTNIETVHLPIITDVDDGNTTLPFKFTLDQNYPNPFNPTTVISYAIPTKAEVTISIYNVLGQEIAVLSQGQQSAGQYSVTWNATNNQGQPTASGMYFYKIIAGNFTASRKMVLLK